MSAPRSEKRLVLRVTRVGTVPVPLPAYHSEGAAGLDLHAALPHPVVLGPGERRLIPTGIAVEIPPGFEGQVRPRSGLALHQGLGLLNAPGTIDSDYRGEIGVILINWGQQPVSIEPFARIAQLVIAPVAKVRIDLVEELEPSRRAGRGFGSTG